MNVLHLNHQEELLRNSWGCYYCHNPSISTKCQKCPACQAPRLLNAFAFHLDNYSSGPAVATTTAKKYSNGRGYFLCRLRSTKLKFRATYFDLRTNRVYRTSLLPDENEDFDGDFFPLAKDALTVLLTKSRLEVHHRIACPKSPLNMTLVQTALSSLPRASQLSQSPHSKPSRSNQPQLREEEAPGGPRSLFHEVIEHGKQLAYNPATGRFMPIQLLSPNIVPFDSNSGGNHSNGSHNGRKASLTLISPSRSSGDSSPAKLKTRATAITAFFQQAKKASHASGSQELPVMQYVQKMIAHEQEMKRIVEGCRLQKQLQQRLGSADSLVSASNTRKGCWKTTQHDLVECELCGLIFPTNSLLGRISYRAVVSWKQSHGVEVAKDHRMDFHRLHDAVKLCVFCTQFFEDIPRHTNGHVLRDGNDSNNSNSSLALTNNGVVDAAIIAHVSGVGEWLQGGPLLRSNHYYKSLHRQMAQKAHSRSLSRPTSRLAFRVSIQELKSKSVHERGGNMMRFMRNPKMTMTNCIDQEKAGFFLRKKYSDIKAIADLERKKNQRKCRSLPPPNKLKKMKLQKELVSAAPSKTFITSFSENSKNKTSKSKRSSSTSRTGKSRARGRSLPRDFSWAKTKKSTSKSRLQGHAGASSSFPPPEKKRSGASTSVEKKVAVSSVEPQKSNDSVSSSSGSRRPLVFALKKRLPVRQNQTDIEKLAQSNGQSESLQQLMQQTRGRSRVRIARPSHSCEPEPLPQQQPPALVTSTPQPVDTRSSMKPPAVFVIKPASIPPACLEEDDQDYAGDFFEAVEVQGRGLAPSSLISTIKYSNDDLAALSHRINHDHPIIQPLPEEFESTMEENEAVESKLLSVVPGSPSSISHRRSSSSRSRRTRIIASQQDRIKLLSPAIPSSGVARPGTETSIGLRADSRQMSRRSRRLSSSAMSTTEEMAAGTEEENEWRWRVMSCF